ncbi:MAG TPA: MATE family efflux transporter [Stellaceae bacterium]|nr:MATE family efflux transporter [Stellaceae bacterium]
MDSRTRALLEAPIGPTLLRLALPNVIVMVVQSCIGLIETYFVAKLGTDALAGISLVFPVLMLVQMVSAGAMGGGILSAVARALGAGKREEANGLVWHAVALALLLGIVTTVAALAGGPFLYRLMGGSGGSLAAALIYSNIVFTGAILFWLYNSLAAIIRGAGNMILPASVTAGGAIILLPLSPALISGWGPLPHLGIAGGAIAVICFYAVGSVIFVTYLWSGRGVLQPKLRPARLRWAPMADILRVGALSSLISVSTNIIIGTATGFAGSFGPAAVAGYGTGARLEYVLVPLVFGLGSPLATMVGTAIGAGQRERALRVTWTGAAIATLMTEVIGIAAALWPQAWLGLFSSDPLMNATGTHYLHIVGPFYGFFGLGLSLYFASQGAGKLTWPLRAAGLRLVVAIGGGWLALHLMPGNIAGVFVVLGLALTVFGTMNAAAIALGAWFGRDGKRNAPLVPQPAATLSE